MRTDFILDMAAISCATCAVPLRVGTPEHGTYTLNKRSVLACSEICAQMHIACALVGMPTQKRSAADADLAPPEAKQVAVISASRKRDARRVRAWRFVVDTLLGEMYGEPTVAAERVLVAVIPIGRDIATAGLISRLQSLSEALRALEGRIFTPHLDYSFDEIGVSVGTIVAEIQRQIARQDLDQQYPGLRAQDSYLNPSVTNPDIFDRAAAYLTRDSKLAPTFSPMIHPGRRVVALDRGHFYAGSLADDRNIAIAYGYDWTVDKNNMYFLENNWRDHANQNYYAFRNQLCIAYKNKTVPSQIGVGPMNKRKAVSLPEWQNTWLYIDVVTSQVLAIPDWSEEVVAGAFPKTYRGRPQIRFDTYDIGDDWSLSPRASRILSENRHSEDIAGSYRAFHCGIIIHQESIAQGDYTVVTLYDFDAGQFQRFDIFVNAGPMYVYPIGKTHLLVHHKRDESVRDESFFYAEDDMPRTDYIRLIKRAQLPSAGILSLEEYGGSADALVEINDITDYGQTFTPKSSEIRHIYVDQDRFYIVAGDAEIHMFLLNQL